MAVTINGSGPIAGATTVNGLTLPTDSLQPGYVLVASNTFGSSSSVSINNCFTSAYQNYRIMFWIYGSATADIFMRFRGSGSDRTDSSYLYGASIRTSANADASFGASGISYLPIQSVGNSFYLSTSMDVLGPLGASGISVNWQGMSWNGTSFLAKNVLGLYNAGSLADGFTFYPSTGTMSGNVRVYGMRNA